MNPCRGSLHIVAVMVETKKLEEIEGDEPIRGKTSRSEEIEDDDG